jgi:hypothetical protein
MNANDAKAFLEKALSKLLKDDLKTFGDSIGERPIVFRIAHYLAAAAEIGGLSVDCDYNRHGNDPKRDPAIPLAGLPSKQEEVHGMAGKKTERFFPDIVLHKRRSDECNILVCEIKRASDNRSPEIDRDRLKILTTGQFHYEFGAFITVDQTQPCINVEYFAKGTPNGATWKAPI